MSRRVMLLMVLLALCGARALAAPPDPTRYGQWSSVIQWPIIPIHLTVLPNGKVLAWDRFGGSDAAVWDPQSGSFTPVPLATEDPFCAGHAVMDDGVVLVTGGHITDGVGEPKAHLFDYHTNSWTRVDDMNAGRWYPTNTVLADGQVLVVSGNIDNVVGPNPIPQVWKRGSGWRTLSTASLLLPLYPRMHLAPNGQVFNSGPNTTSYYLDTTGTGTWTPVTSLPDFRDYGSSVLYDDGKILVAGGGDPPLATAAVIDLNQPAPRWRTVSPMGHARRHHNATLLPDGKVFVNGGTANAGFNNACGFVLIGEMWDPVAEKFSYMASAAQWRLYHSTSVLLPDGRVLTGGGGEPISTECHDVNHPNVEIFSPPYLFKGARPTLTSAPAQVSYGGPFIVTTPDAASITQVNWVRLSSATHAFDQNQRINRLAFTPTSGGLRVTPPTNPNLCPPGHYMLFILNGSGVPSVAAIIQIK